MSVHRVGTLRPLSSSSDIRAKERPDRCTFLRRRRVHYLRVRGGRWRRVPSEVC